MNKQLQKCAEILVECGRADYISDLDKKLGRAVIVERMPEVDHLFASVDPFSDTLEGRRQADVIEDWLYGFKPDLYTESLSKHWHGKGRFGQRIERIKWCIESLIGGEK